MKKKELTASLENYIEVIYQIVRQRGVARVKEIAKNLSVRMPSVNSALKALQERGLVEHTRYGYVELTAEGEEAAQKVLRRHETLCEFLHEVLDIDRDTAEDDACRIEHVISRQTFDRILSMVEYFQTCTPEDRSWLPRFHEYCEKGPRGGSWSTEAVGEGEAGGRERKKMVSLANIRPGQRAIVHRLLGAGAVHQRMLDMGVVPGTPLMVERVAPLGDPIEIKVRGYHLTLRQEEAAKIKVIPLEDQHSQNAEGNEICADQGR